MVARMSSDSRSDVFDAVAQRRHGEIKNIQAGKIHVVFDVFVNEECAVGADLPQTGYSRLYGQTLLLEWRIAFDDERHFGRGPTTDICPSHTLINCGSSSRLRAGKFGRSALLADLFPRSENIHTSVLPHTSSETYTSGRAAPLYRHAPGEKRSGPGKRI